MTADHVNTCFVISPFGEPYDTYFTMIVKPALEECGMYAVRGDSLYRPTTIVDDIWQGLRDATLLVAELTDRNPNVFYELGLAHAISKPVVLISKTIDDVPFDLRAIRVLLYDKDQPDWGQRLRADLIRAIREVLQSPTTAIPTTFKTPVRSEAPEEPETLMRLEALEAAVQRLAGSAGYSRGFEDFLARNPSADEALATKKIPKLKPGQQVLHRLFGKGKVLSVVGRGESSRAQINFDQAGTKWLALAVATLDVVSE